MDLGIRNRTAVVLASSRGLGRGCAERLAEAGCRLALCARSRDSLERTAEELKRKYDVPVLAQTVDVTVSEDRNRFLEAARKEYGALDIMVINSGGPPAGTIEELPETAWREAAASTLYVAVDWARAVLPDMKKNRWGRILFIESYSIKQPVDGLVLSNTMRAGVAGFAKTLSREVAADGILIHVVCPGSHNTDRLRALAEKKAEASGKTPEGVLASMASEIPVGRLGTPGEFGNVIAFLASERASYLTGTTIQVDGGLSRGLL